MSVQRNNRRWSRRAFLRVAVGAGAGAILAACGQATTTTPTTAPAATTAATTAPEATAPAQLPSPPAPGPLTAADAGGMEKLIELARAEGNLSTIALPDDWANYGEMKKKFLEKYPFIKHEDLNPDFATVQKI
jgi:putative spermidine/putrescine transport system substrate-binding protein